MTVQILTGDCRAVLATLAADSVHCVVCSPPYWGLRSYIADGDPLKPFEIGLEADFTAYTAAIVAVFREVHRVLRPDGTLWINLGDSYASGGRGGNPTEASSTLEGGQGSQRASMIRRSKVPNIRDNGSLSYRAGGNAVRVAGLKPKDLIGLPWRIAFALQEDGWYLRQDIIWSKPNPMPESVTDRCTKAHEYLFLLAKSERYYFDQNAIREPFADASIERLRQDISNQRGSDRVPGKTNGPMKAVGLNANRSSYKPGSASSMNEGEHIAKADSGLPLNEAGRNKRSVWEVTTQPFKEAHFATFPPALIEPCIKAGCPIGGTVLDPFGGSGTTGLVADRLKRNAILIELNPEYAAMAARRVKGDAPLLSEVA